MDQAELEKLHERNVILLWDGSYQQHTSDIRAVEAEESSGRVQQPPVPAAAQAEQSSPVHTNAVLCYAPNTSSLETS